MPNLYSSPQLRQPKSPASSRSKSSIYSSSHLIETPPLPPWDTPTSPYTSMTRSSRHVLSPHRAAPAPPPVPPLPASPSPATMYGLPSASASASPSPNLHSSPIVRSASSSSYSSTASSTASSSSFSSSSSTTSQRVSTPPPPVRSRRASRSNPKLLPALPLSIATGSEHNSPYASPASVRSKRIAVDYSSEGIGLGLNLTDEVQIIVSREGRRSRAVSVSYGSSSDSTSSNTSTEDLAYLPTPPMTSSSPMTDRTPSRSSIRNQNTNISTSTGTDNTPPRPARRSASLYPSPSSAIAPSSRKSPLLAPRPLSLTPQSHSDLLPPQPDFARSISPSGESISTVTLSPASTPRPFSSDTQPKPTTLPPDSSTALTTALGEISTSIPMGGRKRDSAQRRLSALRGLVANLDFNQPWSFSENTLAEENPFSPELDSLPDNGDGGYFWAFGGEQPELSEVEVEGESSDESFVMTSSSGQALASPVTSISRPLPYLDKAKPKSIIQHEIAESHGWPEPKSSIQEVYSSPSMSTMNNIVSSASRIDLTPIRRNSGSRKQPSSTPPRRPKQFGSSSELLSRTPEPPRPASRARREVFEVASSGYSNCLEPASPLLPATPTSTWRSSLSNDEIYTRLLQTCGPMEVKRQEVIWEMCETEHAFINSMRTVLRLFATPLKTPQGRWIDGIPGRITELFDSLECITHAHGVLSTCERDMRRKSDVLDVESFVSTFKSWVPRLEVHEWYLIRFESVVALVEENVRDPDSVFGEFVRMQMKEEVLGSMSLGSMLLKPVQRLTKYPLFLKRLLDVTPHPHRTHPEILSLLSATESIILNLQATKAREEDFEQLQSLESRLVGLPESFTLAIRGRKLLGQAQVVRVPPARELSSAIAARGRSGSMHSSRGSISSSVSSSAPSSISPWDFSASLTPSRTSAFSVSSNGSSFCSGPPSRSNSITKPSPSFSSITSPSRPSVTRSPSSTSSFIDNSRPSTPSSMKNKKKEDILTMLIFDDLILLGNNVHEKSGLFSVGSNKKKTNGSLRVLSELEGGVGKVSEVKDWSGWNGYSNLCSITLTPVSHSCRYPSSPITIAFTLPSSSSSSSLQGSLSTSPSLRSLKSSLTQSSGWNLTCPTLNNLPSLLGMLGQVSTSGMTIVRGSEYVVEEKEILEDSMSPSMGMGMVMQRGITEEVGDEGEWLGYAA
ncbi:uncharacterized protein IL334_001913 [Kwoniella shivajii]|uniref:DH domain-containing protein n=1 Tax=Kwoniella shivajii TaxID=564305 RepID=A0ABZ1CT81_9TREE|nr:hypothetical protein IL334_001913 [Kwoniella shivajii]